MKQSQENKHGYSPELTGSQGGHIYRRMCIYRKKFILRNWPSRCGRCMRAESLQSCPTLCDPMDCSLLGSSVHGIIQARILKWVAIPFSRESSQLRD